jgi:ribosomal protein S18 acetylase RimI-like enzyme
MYGPQMGTVEVRIDPFEAADLDAVVELSLAAWAPVFESIREAMDADVFDVFYPDWREEQARAVTEACRSDEMTTRVARMGAHVVGFAASKMHDDGVLGEIHMIAVDPGHQRHGVARALTADALDILREAGAQVAMVDTGGDPGHAPARATYEDAGFRALPIARYFKKL